jgi:hypothetical protein
LVWPWFFFPKAVYHHHLITMIATITTATVDIGTGIHYSSYQTLWPN